MNSLSRGFLALAAISCSSASKPPRLPTSESGGPALTSPLPPELTPTTAPPAKLPDWVAAYSDIAEKIEKAALSSNGAFEKLAYLTDRIGSRVTGSVALEKAVEWARSQMAIEGHERVRAEPVQVVAWQRGEEKALVKVPFPRPLAVMALGGSGATPKAGITAKVVVVKDIADLEAHKDAVKGSIVLFTKAMPAYDKTRGTGYGDTVDVRGEGPAAAAKLGAKAALVRSVTARSLATLHTGGTWFDEGQKAIPAAAVSIEDAMWMERLSQQNVPIEISLTIGAQTAKQPKTSHNVIAELRGREKPEEIVILSGHLDSWDVGQGAHDDGAGVVVAMQTITLLRQLGLTPRRTIRVVLWTNEEHGVAGAKQYAIDHEAELSNHVLAIEMDTGGFAPTGFGIHEHAAGLAHARAIAPLLASVGANTMINSYSGSDVMQLEKKGVITAGLMMDSSTYFDYHHTHADTLDKVNPQDLQKDVAAMAIFAYVVADMPTRFGSEPQ